MIIAALEQRARAAALQIAAWGGRRLKEPSTYVGLGLVAADLGFPGVASDLATIGRDLPVILAIGGAGLAAATTSQHPPVPQTLTGATGRVSTGSAKPSPGIAQGQCAGLIRSDGTVHMENDMSIASSLKKALGFVAGILIPGASVSTTDLTHSVQQEIADAFGAGAAELAQKLALDTTGMSGPDKVFAITKALVATAESQGIKADASIVGAVALDVAQAAYRKTLTNFESGLVALASAITSAGGLKTVTTLVVDAAEGALKAAA